MIKVTVSDITEVIIYSAADKDDTTLRFNEVLILLPTEQVEELIGDLTDYLHKLSRPSPTVEK